MKYFVTLNGHTREVTVDGARVLLDGVEHEASLSAIGETPLRQLSLDGGCWTFPMDSAGAGHWSFLVEGYRVEVEVVDQRTEHIRSLAAPSPESAGPGVLKAPMPGLVVRVLVEPGQQVAPGTSLVVLEAMKMENELRASAAGIVERVMVSEGQAVEKAEVLLSFRGTAG
jgi:biotin carboxyl carrier protein